MNENIIINTGNKKKQKEIQELIDKEVKFTSFDLPEIKSQNPLEIVIYKTKLLKDILQTKDILITEDVTFEINGIFEPEIKWKINELKQNDKIKMILSIGMYNPKNNTFEAFKKVITGKIDLNQPNNFNFGFDNIFIVKNKQFGEYKKQNNPRKLYKELLSKKPDYKIEADKINKWFYDWQEPNKQNLIVTNEKNKRILFTIDKNKQKTVKAMDIHTGLYDIEMDINNISEGKILQIPEMQEGGGKVLEVVDISNRIQTKPKYINKTKYSNYHLFSDVRIQENHTSYLPLEVIHILKQIDNPKNAKEITNKDIQKYSKNLLVNFKTKEFINLTLLIKNLNLNNKTFIPLEILFMKKSKDDKKRLIEIAKIFYKYLEEKESELIKNNNEKNIFFNIMFILEHKYLGKFDIKNVKILPYKEASKLIKQGYKDITNDIKIETILYNKIQENNELNMN